MFFTAFTTIAIADDPTIDRLLASQCAQCHGTNGYAVGDMDGLDDESPKDLYEDLMDMRSEDRAEDIMEHQAMGYTEEQILRIANWYGLVSGKSGEQPEIEERDEDDD
jgi:sulfide dehydrogenase cytochrome subunit